LNRQLKELFGRVLLLIRVE